MDSPTPVTVGDVMSTPLQMIEQRATIMEAAEVMRTSDVSALFVAGGAPGIVTSTDILDAVADGVDVADRHVAEVMTSPIESVPPDVSVREAAAMMTGLGVKHLPVTSDSVHGDDYVGMVSSTDVAEHFS